MTKRRPLFVLTVLSLTTWGLPCCLAYDPTTPMKLLGENAIIIWDADNKIEHFVRQADFEGKADNFGFIVPTPTLPVVAEASEDAFRVLSSLEPTKHGIGIGCSSVPASEAASDAASVEVIDQYQVGDFEVSILKATDGVSINAWLKMNGYSSRPAMTQWLDHYAKMTWYFAALKLIRTKGSDTPTTKAIRVTFKTDVPFYPYKMPEDTWPSGQFRPIQLYFVASGLARGKYRGSSSNWEADIEWTEAMNEEKWRELAKNLGLLPKEIPFDATVTSFSNSNEAIDYSRDIYFLTYSSFIPTWLLGVLGIGFVGFFAHQLRKRKARLELNRIESQSVSD